MITRLIISTRSAATPRCCKHKQNEFEPYDDLADQAFLQFNGHLLTTKTHIAKLNIMKHQGQNIPMKVIQNKEKQTKLLQKIAEGKNSLNSKKRFNFQCVQVVSVVHYIMGIMLNHSISFFQPVEAQVNYIWEK